jgi:hypothetical protein
MNVAGHARDIRPSALMMQIQGLVLGMLPA